ncbi:TPA: hypothetical protein R8J12_000230 [Campylobacter jejuni]|nr:hypothetical protein [Campylobacter jejuni]
MLIVLSLVDIVVFRNVTDYNSNFQFVSRCDEYGYKV